MLSSAFILAASMLSSPRIASHHAVRAAAAVPHWFAASGRANLRAARMQSTATSAAASSTATSFEELDASNIFDKFELIKTGASARLDLTTLALSPRPACFLCLSC